MVGGLHIPPEKLRCALLLQMLYSVRGEHQLMEYAATKNGAGEDVRAATVMAPPRASASPGEPFAIRSSLDGGT